MRGQYDLPELKINPLLSSEKHSSEPTIFDTSKKRFSVNLSPGKKYSTVKRMSDNQNLLEKKSLFSNQKSYLTPNNPEKISFLSVEKKLFFDLNNFEFPRESISQKKKNDKNVQSHYTLSNYLRKKFLMNIETADSTMSSDNYKQFLGSFTSQFISTISKLTHSDLDPIKIFKINFFEGMEKRTKLKENSTIKLADLMIDSRDYQKSIQNTNRTFENNTNEFIFEITNHNEISKMKVKIYK